MWAAQVKAYSSGTLKGIDLEGVAGDKALAKIKVTALYYQGQDTVTRGEPKLSPKVTALDTTAHSATITDCIDSTDFVQIEKKTGKPIALLDSNRRHLGIYTARTLAGTWRITDFDISRNHTC